MLNARRENMLTTRLSTPGLSSISATTVCLVTVGWLQHHVLDGPARRDHRVDVLFGDDLQVAEHWPVVRLGLGDDAAGFLLGGGAQRLDPVGVGDLAVVGRAEVRRRVPLLVED